ncbi:MAG: hypothetical protein ACE5EI_04765 [Thermodesulfobacteriota bacterium]
MKEVVGIIVALAAEGQALAGRQGWKKEGPYTVKRNRLADGSEIITCVAGMGMGQAAGAARWLVAEGAGALISAGIGGGLSPRARPGDVIIGQRLMEDRGGDGVGEGGGVIHANALLAEIVLKALEDQNIPARRDTIVTVHEAVLTGHGKARLHERTGAAAVDMESYAVARAAVEAGLPFVVMRAVCDPATRTISPHLANTLDPEGRPRPLALLGRVLRRPGLVTQLLRLRGELNSALGSLAAAWKAQVEREIPGLITHAGRGRTEEVKGPAAAAGRPGGRGRPGPTRP